MIKNGQDVQQLHMELTLLAELTMLAELRFHMEQALWGAKSKLSAELKRSYLIARL